MREAIRADVQKSALAFFGRDLTELARRGKLEPVIGRKDEILRVGGWRKPIDGRCEHPLSPR